MLAVFDNFEMNPTFIFIDGSYYCFYRYYALHNWWKNAYPEEKLVDPLINQTFVDKFKKTFVENIKQLPKKLNINKDITPIIIVGKDCKRENIWRMELFSQYKGTRVNNDGFLGGPFFKMAYEENLFVKGGAKAILNHSKLEADDCIAISVKHLVNKYPKCNIYIITSDRDYLQLKSENVHLYNLAFKNIGENKSSTGNAKDDLLIKIIMGDSSDNIPAIFPKCGPKTAEKCIKDPEFFKKKMANNEEYYKQFELNKKLVDFDNIPSELVEEFTNNPTNTK
uniref:5'-3' exonuclease domain-containing protein n=1 Tax=viral metagenome TaxID=1070528 RepID=A0A6C0EPV3_9ZZZZ